MKVTSATTTLPSRPSSLYSKTSIKRKEKSPPTSSSSSSSTQSNAASANFNHSSLSKRKESPLRQSIRRTPTELLGMELQRLSDEKLVRKDASSNQDLVDLLEADYRDDIKNWLFFMEEKTAASVELIDLQPEVKWYMRPYLVDFLVEIHLQLRLRPETLYLALNIVDRYVSKRIVFKKHYQLVGCVGLWIASKFEDAKDRVPTLPDLASMCSNAYDESAFVQMEQHVLSSINWVVGHPTSESWLRLACVTKTGLVEEKLTQNCARFLMEITLFYKEFLVYKSSELAVAALVLARFILGKSRRVMDESPEVLQIAALLDTHFAERLETVSAIVVKKYAPSYFSRASTHCLEWYLSGKRFSYHTSTSTSPTLSTFSPVFTNSSFPSSPASSTYSVRSFDSLSPHSTLPTRSNSNSSSSSSQSSFSSSYRSSSTAPSSVATSDDEGDGEDTFLDTPTLECYSPSGSSTFSSRPNSYYSGGTGMEKENGGLSSVNNHRIEKSPLPVSFRRIPFSPSNPPSSYQPS